MNGLLIVDKPAGLTSAEVVRRVKARVGGKVGHLGTLDPFATGVLPLCIGEGTKIAQFLNTSDKRYEGFIRLGSATDTGDRTGVVVRTAPVPPLDEGRLVQVAERFTGEISQVPPMYSAIKRQGVPLYRLARKGIEVAREARSIHLASLHLAIRESDLLWFEVACSKGTYVRALAEDIGIELGSVAHLESLRRTRFGPFDITRAVQLDAWNPNRSEGVVTIREALDHLPAVHLTPAQASAARQGRASVLNRLQVPEGASAAVLVDPNGDVVAVIVKSEARWTYGRVLQASETLQPERPMLSNRENKTEERWG
jgi:tRNA pseudouridine55 synthase